MKLWLINKQTKEKLADVKSISQGKKFMEEYEYWDKLTDIYEPDLYDIVDKSGESVL